MAAKTRTVVLAFSLITLLVSAGMSVLAEESIFLKEGRDLYTSLCSRCHGDIGDSTKAGRSMNRIRSALRRFDQHKDLKTLPDEQILLISVALEAEK